MHAEQDEGIAHFPGPHRSDSRRPLTVALVGSHTLTGVPDSLFEFIRTLPTGSRILLRRGMKSAPGLFERTMAAFCNLDGIWCQYEWVLPDPIGGREATYLRDVAMTRRADLVLAYFADDKMEGGTEHVVEKALDAGTPVYSFGRVGDRFIRIGEHDPDDVYGSIVPTV